MRNKCKRISIYVFPLLIIMLFVLWYKDVNYYPKILGDEYGYWAAGAHFAGLDWDDVTALNDYYGWGYGALLSVLLRFPLSAKTSYLVAIALNGVMLWGIYIIFYSLTREIFPRKSESFRIVLSFACTILPSSLFYTQFTLSEVILEFIYMVILYEFWSLLKKFDVRKLVLITILNSVLFSIHLRTLGVIVISGLSVLLVCLKVPEKRIKRILLFVFLQGLGLLGVMWIKSNYQDSIALDFVLLSSKNTASGQLGKFQTLMTFDGMKSFLLNVLGRIYSLIMHSHIMALVTILAAPIAFIRNLRGGKKDDITTISTICVLDTLSLVAISALFMIGHTDDRFDIMTYSRYHEFSVGVLFFFGVYYLEQNINKKVLDKILLFGGVALLGASKIIRLNLDYNAYSGSIFIQNPIDFLYFKHLNNSTELYILMLLVSLAMFVTLFILIKYGNIKLVTFALASIILINIYTSNYTFKEGCLSWSVPQIVETDTLYEFIMSNDYQQSLCFLADDDSLKIQRLQYALKDEATIEVVSEDMLSDKMAGSYILITTADYSGTADISEYELVFSTYRLSVWRENKDANSTNSV